MVPRSPREWQARIAALRPDHDENPVADRLNPLIVNHSWAVVGVFLLITIGMLVAAPGAFAAQEAGAGQFEEDVEAFDALEAMEEDFERGERASGGTSAQLFVEDERNILSRDRLLAMATVQERLEADDSLRVTSTTSPASLVAQAIDPSVDGGEDARRTIARATDRQLATAIETQGNVLPVSADFSPQAGSASVAQIAITYDTPPAADSAQFADLQRGSLAVADDVDGFKAGENLFIFGDAVLNEEVLQLLGDTAIIVFPAAILLILFFLLVAYRDPIDLAVGLAALVMTLIWTFGFMGIVGIPFSDALITVFPLLLAVGIDFGIHIINRYREERERGLDIGEAMWITGDQLQTAFLIVTVTTMFALAANLTSPLQGLRDFGIVAAFGMAFTFAIFGVFLPAAKVALDRVRVGTPIPQFGTKPLGREGSLLGRALTVGAVMAKVAPAAVLVVALIIGGAAGAYGTGVDVEFDETVFFPSQERIDQYQALPDPLAPSQYNFMQILHYLEEDFEIPFVQTITVYASDPAVRDDVALVDVDRAITNPPAEFQSSDRRAQADSILDVIEEQRAIDPAFDDRVRAADRTGNGVPDRDVDRIYDELFAGPAAADAGEYVTTDRSALRIQFQPTVDADDDAVVAAAEDVADGMVLDATATGQYVVFQQVTERISESALNSLVVAFVLTAIFLVITYWWLEGRAIYGVLNLVPVLISVALLAGSMRVFDVALSPFNAPIFGIAIGIGVDYTVHFMHRFVDEFESGADVHEALRITAQGTGGALTGSMLTTVCGLGVLVVALIPLIVEYGLLLALGVFYAWASAILILPAVVVVWARVDGDGWRALLPNPTTRSDRRRGSATSQSPRR